MEGNYMHKDITDRVIKCFFKVYNTLGYGFLEKIYENSMLIELRAAGLACTSQYPINVYYNEIKVGFYIADVIVNNAVILEMKTASALCPEHEAQLTNYLRATDIEVGLLLNFGKEPAIKRKVFSAAFKKNNNHKDPVDLR